MPSRLKSIFEVSSLKPAYGQGLRGGIAWAICLLAGFHFDQMSLGIQAGFVGWIVAFCDDSTGTARRFLGASVMTLVAGAATFITVFLMISFTSVTWWAFAVGASAFIVSALGLLVEGGCYLSIWRVVDTLIAAGFVAAGMFLLWPTSARTVATQSTANALRAIGIYLQRSDSGVQPQINDDRRNAFRESGALGQRVQEYSREPRHDPELAGELRSTLVDVQHMVGLVTEISKLDAESRKAGES